MNEVPESTMVARYRLLDAPTLAPPIRRSCRSTLYDEPDDEYGIQFQCDAAAGSAPPITSAPT